jgi:hypothetical protein
VFVAPRYNAVRFVVAPVVSGVPVRSCPGKSKTRYHCATRQEADV